MSDHLTELDMMRYAKIQDLTEENVAFVADVHRHVFACERCKLLLDMVCEQEAQMTYSHEENVR